MTTSEKLKIYWREYHRKRRLDPLQRELDNKKQRERRKANPEKAKESSRKSEQSRRLKTYGLTIEDYNSILTKQNYLCGICNTKLENNRLTHVDHNHITGKVRGILCHHCNILLGNARDDTNILRSAILYLKENNE